ncbi:meiotic recombination protein REC114 isoform X3 [Synchiropus splendidus]|uniref:meiotic recombination protein REC114 isoform X3 n=1 Tax=Synchiropus splendidus TaxID=270530 RepID=UPI00237D6AD9|nr:meiotic recombination protein REC114 isoform X3 [Synchiropus splendidus]
MTDSVSWRLTRYGKYIPRTGEETSEQPDKLYESKRKDPEIVLTIVGSGYLLILQGQASLGQSCLIRMQFDGRTRGVAIKECSSAVGKLKEYLPASSFDDAPVPLHQPPTEISPPPMQTDSDFTPDLLLESSSMQRLAQHYLGEGPLILPQLHHQETSDSGDLGLFIRQCLLDPTFHAFVEKVEKEMKKILQE